METRLYPGRSRGCDFAPAAESVTLKIDQDIYAIRPDASSALFVSGCVKVDERSRPRTYGLSCPRKGHRAVVRVSFASSSAVTVSQIPYVRTSGVGETD